MLNMRLAPLRQAIQHSSVAYPGGFSGCPERVIFFPTLGPGSGNFQLSRLVGLGYGLGLGFWVVITIIVSLTLTLTLITTLAVILP